MHSPPVATVLFLCRLGTRLYYAFTAATLADSVRFERLVDDVAAAVRHHMPQDAAVADVATPTASHGDSGIEALPPPSARGATTPVAMAHHVARAPDRTAGMVGGGVSVATTTTTTTSNSTTMNNSAHCNNVSSHHSNDTTLLLM